MASSFSSGLTGHDLSGTDTLSQAHVFGGAIGRFAIHPHGRRHRRGLGQAADRARGLSQPAKSQKTAAALAGAAARERRRRGEATAGSASILGRC